MAGPTGPTGPTGATGGSPFTEASGRVTYSGANGMDLTGATARIRGDFSSAAASRTYFQSTTTNGTTAVGAIPNGTGAASYWVGYNASDVDNASYGWLSVTSTGMDLYSNKSGTGTVQPIRFITNDSTRFTVGASGGADFATGVREYKVAVSASEIDCREGNYFTKTISTTTTFTVANVPSTGTAFCLVLDLTNGGAATVNWWSGMKWAGGTAPTLTSSGRDVLAFFTHDGGTTWSGFVLGKDVK